ncbi:MAG: yagI [Firmicutes bacterium]|nr:yagI [Bacillota bacterium]
MSNDKDSIQSIARALDILLLLHQEDKEMGVTQISSALGMYKSTVCRTLATLENKGFVQQNTETGKYWMGLKLYSLGMQMRRKMPLQNIAAPLARALSEKFNEVVHIAVLDPHAENFPKQIIIDKFESQQVLSFTPGIGSASACHGSAVGKCLLAFSEPEYLVKFQGCPLPVFTGKTIIDWPALLRELAAIREKGYALDDEELELGLTCIAAPIVGRDHAVVAALSLSGPTSRLQGDRCQEIIQQVRKTATAISALL